MNSIYLDLTNQFNEAKFRAIICSGQAVVLHRLAIMSKDGDWILREDNESLGHVLSVLEKAGATYRFGAPLDLRWMQGGWSSHFEFPHGGIRVRTDFFTRPPRLSDEDLEHLWIEQEGKTPPFTGLVELAKLKMTQREKDYPVIGELARLMNETEDQLRYSRSARDLCLLCREHVVLAGSLAETRPLLGLAISPDADPDRVAEALDAERRHLIKLDANRLERYELVSDEWRKSWPAIRARIEGLPLGEAHAIVCDAASTCLPTRPLL